MYQNKTISLILPAYNEEESIVSVIMGFYKIGIFDEVILVDNNSKDKTALLAKNTNVAKVIKEQKQGYGFAIQKGLKVATGDILVLCDVDNTYIPKDVFRLLKHISKHDLVISTRTRIGCNLKGSNMYGLRKYANIIIARLMQILFSGPSMSDLGATFRVIKRTLYKKISSKFTVGGIHFQPELTILTLTNGFKVIEIPVRYRERSGRSKISGAFIGGMKTAWKMLSLILKYRFSLWIKKLSFI